MRRLDVKQQRTPHAPVFSHLQLYTCTITPSSTKLHHHTCIFAPVPTQLHPHAACACCDASCCLFHAVPQPLDRRPWHGHCPGVNGVGDAGGRSGQVQRARLGGWNQKCGMCGGATSHSFLDSHPPALPCIHKLRPGQRCNSTHPAHTFPALSHFLHSSDLPLAALHWCAASRGTGQVHHQEVAR